MTPGLGVLVLGRGHTSHLVKMHYFFKNLLLFTQVLIRQTEDIVMITMEALGSSKIVNFMTPGAGVFVLGPHPYKIYSKNAIFSFFCTLRYESDISIYNTLITTVLLGYNSTFFFHYHLFYLFYDWPVNMQI